MSSLFRSRGRIRDEFGVSLSPLPRGDRWLGGFNGLGWSRSLRAHRVGLEEFLEDWYDRSAETCTLFESISEVDKYCLTCTVCRHFEEECCSLDFKGPIIISLLKACYNHDGLT